MKNINNGKLIESYLNQTITVYGWANKIRKFGKITFIDLRDESGIIQLVIDDLNEKVTLESVLQASGKLVLRKDENPDLATGKFEIIVDEFKVLNLSQELPFVIDDEKNVREELALQYRYLDLRKKSNHDKIILRANVIKYLRQALESYDFMEIETPILSKSTPEGARDYLVPTRKHGHFFSLPQSPQLFKQLLMAAGFEKYYQMARVFRDEDSRKDRQPEFTQLDIEMSFQNSQVLQTIIEDVFQKTFAKLGIEIKLPMRRMDYDDAIKYYGIDKPDLRYEVKIKDVKSYFDESEFKIISDKKNIAALVINNLITKKDHAFLEQVANKNGAKILWFFNVENGEITTTNFAKKDLVSANKLKALLNGKDGSFLITAEDYYMHNQEALGAVRVELNEMFKYAKEDIYEFVWIEKWPLFEHDFENDTYSPAHHAFTMYDDKTLVDGKLDFVKTKALAYDLVLNGYEIGGGSQRIHDHQIQTSIFEKIGLTNQKIQDQFGFFINAFKYGFPPSCGIAFGIERITAIISNSNSIRDVIAFPKNSKGVDLMTEAPSIVADHQLDELDLAVVEKDK